MISKDYGVTKSRLSSWNKPLLNLKPSFFIARLNSAACKVACGTVWKILEPKNLRNFLYLKSMCD